MLKAATIEPAMTTPQAKLPDDIAQCHAMIEAQAQTIQQLASRVDFLLRRLFGSRSERMDPNQLVLDGIEAEAPPRPAPEETPAAAPAKRKGHGRKRLAEDLPRKRIVHDIPEEEKVCPNGKARVVIGEDVSEQLDYTPASYFVIEHVRPVYACTDPACDCGVRQAAKPAQPIEKGIAGAGLLAHVIVSKYCDHLPLHRQERIIARHGVELSRKTLCGWVLQAAEVLRPVAEAMCARVLQSRVIHTDDTPVRVQDLEKKRTTRKAYLWPYVGDPDHPYIIFDYTPTRAREGPERFLAQFTGTEHRPRYLQCDAYPGYDGLFAKDRHCLEVACWAHARRKFHDARTSDSIRAHHALTLIGELYEVERDAKPCDDAQRLALRKERAVPKLAGIEKWLIETKAAVLPKSAIGQAVDYALGNWKALERYTTDACLAIDNNAAEQAIRAIAVGRKNWLFFGSDRGGHAAAIHFSLIASARRHGLDPFAYLRDLLTRIPTHPNRLIHELFPGHWKRLAEEAPATGE
jgi:transposase